MGRKTIDRTGEKGVNNFGSEMVIVEYRKSSDINIYFPKYDWTLKHATYQSFKKRTIKCPYEPRLFGIGYIGEGKYLSSVNGKHTDDFNIWYDMLRRCYDPKFHKREPSYKGCEVEDYLLNFQHMAEWIEDNYYEVPGEKMCLDKDILYKGNKVYSRDICIFIPQKINSLFTKCNKARGNDPIGVSDLPSGNYRVQCRNGYEKMIHLGTYSTKEEAFQVYKNYKENLIKKVIDSYEGKIPEPHYSRLREAMYNYEVEIDD